MPASPGGDKGASRSPKVPRPPNTGAASSSQSSRLELSIASDKGGRSASSRSNKARRASIAPTVTSPDIGQDVVEGFSISEGRLTAVNTHVSRRRSEVPVAAPPSVASRRIKSEPRSGSPHIRRRPSNLHSRMQSIRPPPSAFQIFGRVAIAVAKFFRPLLRRRRRIALALKRSRGAFAIQCVYRRFKAQARIRRYEAAMKIAMLLKQRLSRLVSRRHEAAKQIQRLIRGFLTRRATERRLRLRWVGSFHSLLMRKLLVKRAQKLLHAKRQYLDERHLVHSQFMMGYHQICREEKLAWAAFASDPLFQQMAVASHRRVNDAYLAELEEVSRRNIASKTREVELARIAASVHRVTTEKLLLHTARYRSPRAADARRAGDENLHASPLDSEEDDGTISSAVEVTTNTAPGASAPMSPEGPIHIPSTVPSSGGGGGNFGIPADRDDDAPMVNLVLPSLDGSPASNDDLDTAMDPSVRLAAHGALLNPGTQRYIDRYLMEAVVPTPRSRDEFAGPAFSKLSPGVGSSSPNTASLKAPSVGGGGLYTPRFFRHPSMGLSTSFDAQSSAILPLTASPNHHAATALLSLQDELGFAYGRIIETTEALGRQELERQHSASASRLFESFNWSVYVITAAPIVHPAFRSLLFQTTTRWAAKRAVELFIAEEEARVFIETLHQTVPVRPPWEPTATRIMPEAPSITKPRATRVRRAFERPISLATVASEDPDDKRLGSMSDLFGSFATRRQSSVFTGTDSTSLTTSAPSLSMDLLRAEKSLEASVSSGHSPLSPGGDTTASAFGDVDVDLDDEISERRRHRRFSAAPGALSVSQQAVLDQSELHGSQFESATAVNVRRRSSVSTITALRRASSLHDASQTPQGAGLGSPSTNSLPQINSAAVTRRRSLFAAQGAGRGQGIHVQQSPKLARRRSRHVQDERDTELHRPQPVVYDASAVSRPALKKKDAHSPNSPPNTVFAGAESPPQLEMPEASFDGAPRRRKVAFGM